MVKKSKKIVAAYNKIKKAQFKGKYLSKRDFIANKIDAVNFS